MCLCVEVDVDVLRHLSISRPRVYIQHAPVCTFRTSPCMSATRAHVETHLRVLPTYTVNLHTVGFSACQTTSHTIRQHDNTTTKHNTQQSTTQHNALSRHTHTHMGNTAQHNTLHTEPTPHAHIAHPHQTHPLPHQHHRPTPTQQFTCAVSVQNF